MALPVGQSSETDPGRKGNRPGIYRHPVTKKEIITSPGDSAALAEGVAQADALVRVGFEWVGETPSREELLEAQKKQAEADKADEAKDNVKETK